MIERWELLQANADEFSAQQDYHKLTSDLEEVMSWLDSMLPELDRLPQRKEHPSIQDIENSVCKLKVQSGIYSCPALT